MIAALIDRAVRAACISIAERLPSPRVFSGRGGRYLARWTILDRGPGSWRLCLHFFHRSDEDQELHTHPWGWAAALQVAGGYLEERAAGDPLAPVVETRRCGPGSFVLIAPSTAHRVDLLDPARGSWSLILTGPVVGSWGFVARETGAFTPWRTFVARKGLDPLEPRRRAGGGL